MPVTVLYLNSCRRERLRAAFADNIHFLGPKQAAALVSAVSTSYQHHRSPRVNYIFALHALYTCAGIYGLPAIAIVKEAWNPNSLIPNAVEDHPSVANITHAPTNTIQ